MPHLSRWFAYTALLGGGIAGIIMAEGKKIAMCGFALYAIHGAFGFLEILTNNDTFYSLNRDYTVVLSSALCQGLITTDYCIMSGLEAKKSCGLNLVCPVLYLLVVYIIRNGDLYFIGDLGHGISCVVCAYYGFDKSQYMAYIVSLFYVIIHFSKLYYNESWILAGITSFCAGMLLAGKDFSTLFK
ncbi:uncharacterized protein LOC106667009 [Cimex lectularius]|uniref:Uncharacterized protein n=1 Tax=Cimex lectularius TaxID=79782 RepID=A0A8I6RRI9_CIMLE|nr:uncharacterized protein LOC106667009 [Cimex lectularius]